MAERPPPPEGNGVFITTVDRGLTEEGIEDPFVGGNNPQYGVVAANYLKQCLPESAKIVVMRGIPMTIGNIRIGAFQKELEGSGVEILDKQYANWYPDKGLEVTARLPGPLRQDRRRLGR